MSELACAASFGACLELWALLREHEGVPSGTRLSVGTVRELRISS